MKNILRPYLQPAFLLCVVVLAIGGFGMNFIESYFRLWLEKEPTPLKKSFDQLDAQKLKPFKLIDKRKIENKEILKSLGTEDYIQWVLLDTEARPDNSAKQCMLFITYYDRPDSVPHVPEECYTGGGFQRKSSEPIVFNVPIIPDNNETAKPDSAKQFRKIPGQYVVFSRESSSVWQPSASFPVLYFFNSNGSYVNTRTEARLALARNIRSKHSYFSKVEIVFNQGYNNPDRTDVIETSERLLAVLLPVLEKEHWPDITSLSSDDGDDQER